MSTPSGLLVSHVQPMCGLINVHEVGADVQARCGGISQLYDRHLGRVGRDGRRIRRGRRSGLRSLVHPRRRHCARSLRLPTSPGRDTAAGL